MGNSIPYSSVSASALLDLVDIAGGDLSQAFLPAGLDLVTTFSSPLISSGGLQGLFATGIIGDFNAPVAVLAVSATWPRFTSFYHLSYLTSTVDPGSYLHLAGGDSDKLSMGYSILYNTLRGLIWTGLAQLTKVPGFTSNFPLLIVGMGPAGALAQLVALDLRPGQTGPGAVASPVSAIGCYSFSTPAFANASFAASAGKALSSIYLCNLDGRDYYPSTAGAPADFVFSGVAQPLSAQIPPLDTPWLERTPSYYQTAFGQILPPMPAGGTFNMQPPGFDTDLAYNLSLVSVAAYERFQHPNLSGPVPTGYQWVADIVVSGVTWGALYTGPGSIVVATRGPVSWVEAVQFYGGGYLTPLDWFPSGRILVGLAEFYPGFASTVFAALAKVSGVNSAKLYFAGHDYGGALAALAALDQATTPHSGIPAPTAVYGFGTVRFSDYAFISRGYAALTAVSYQLIRPNDVIASNAGISAMAPLPTLVTLSGGQFSAANSTTGHTLALYASLLNPQAPSAMLAEGLKRSPNAVELGFLSSPAGPRRLVASAETTAPPISSFMTRMATFYAIDPAHLQAPALDTAEHGGSIVLSSSPRDSALPPVKSLADGRTNLACGDILIRAGHALQIESPARQTLTVMAKRIVLEPGGVLRLTTDTRVIAGAFVGAAAGAPANIMVGGIDGLPGTSGPNGASGGGPGGHGTSGGDGSIPAAIMFMVDEIQGLFQVETQGGNGGAGGAGGNGGNGGAGISRRLMRLPNNGGRPIPDGDNSGDGPGFGGNGGSGGNGGAGAHGCDVVVRYRVRDPHAVITFAPYDGRGGPGGAGGIGGAAAGVRGRSGAPGMSGANGPYGATSTLTLEQIT